MIELNRKKALELIPLVIDSEATMEEEEALYRYMQQDEEVWHHFQLMKQFKILMRTRTPRLDIPYDLKSKILDAIQNLGNDDNLF